MDCVRMKEKALDLLSLQVPGLAEKRPSLMQGDIVFAKLGSEKIPYEVCSYNSIMVVLVEIQKLLNFFAENSN